MVGVKKRDRERLNINKRVINEAGGLSRNDTRRARPRCYVLSAGLKKVAAARLDDSIVYAIEL